MSPYDTAEDKARLDIIHDREARAEAAALALEIDAIISEAARAGYAAAMKLAALGVTTNWLSAYKARQTSEQIAGHVAECVREVLEDVLSAATTAALADA